MGDKPLYSIKGLEVDTETPQLTTQNPDMTSSSWEFAPTTKKRAAEGNTVTTLVVSGQPKTQSLPVPLDNQTRHPSSRESLVTEKPIILDMFILAVGASINWHKSNAIWVSNVQWN
jgi:hypothetical protein